MLIVLFFLSFLGSLLYSNFIQSGKKKTYTEKDSKKKGRMWLLFSKKRKIWWMNNAGMMDWIIQLYAGIWPCDRACIYTTHTVGVSLLPPATFVMQPLQSVVLPPGDGEPALGPGPRPSTTSQVTPASLRDQTTKPTTHRAFISKNLPSFSGTKPPHPRKKDDNVKPFSIIFV